MEEDLVNLNGITNEVLSALSSNNIKKLEDLAEMSIASATKKLVDDEANIDVVIDTTTGEYKTYRKWDIVKEIDESEEFQVLESDLDGYEVDEASSTSYPSRSDSST